MKKFVSLLLTIALCFCMIISVIAADTLARVPSTIPRTDIDYNYVENVTIQIPKTEVAFELERVAETVGVRYNNGKPTYCFAFYEGGTIKANTDMEMLYSEQGGNLNNPDLWSWGDGAGVVFAAGEIINIKDYSVVNDSKTTRDAGEATRVQNMYSTTIRNEYDEKIATVEFVSGYGDGVCPYDLISFEGTELVDISNFLPYVVDSTLSIVEPTKTVIRYKDGIILHADVEKTVNNATVEWTTDNNNFKIEESQDGMSCTIISNSKGDTVITATLYDVDGNVLGEDSIKMTSKAGFFDKIIGFFRSLFGISKIYKA